MPDSSGVIDVLTSADYGTLEKLLILIAGTIAIPTAMWFKDKMHYFIRPEFVTAAVSIGAAFILCRVMTCGLPPADLIDLAMKTIGEATILYGGARLVTEYREKKKTTNGGTTNTATGG